MPRPPAHALASPAAHALAHALAARPGLRSWGRGPASGNLARAAELAAARTEASDAELAALAQQRSDMRLRSIAALADLLLAVHWSVRVSPVSPLAVALAGTVSSTIGFHMKWRSTTA